MDLAAERGYAGFLGLRERYWSALDEAGRARALEAGQEVYAHYGDAAAKPRIAVALRRGRREMTGSRNGMVGSLKIYVPGPGGYQQIDGSTFYDARYWEPEKYQQAHAAHWQQTRLQRVTVREVERTAGPDQGTRAPGDDRQPHRHGRQPEDLRARPRRLPADRRQQVLRRALLGTRKVPAVA